MANLGTLRTWNYIWDKLSLFATGVSNYVASPFGSGPIVIDQPMTLYVETTGNDGNPGTADRPFKTIQAVADFLRPFYINSPVTVAVGAGVFGGVKLHGLRGDRHTGTLTIIGTVSTVDTGTLSGTTALAQVSAVVFPTLIDSTKTWTVDAYKGMQIEITNGASVGFRFNISSNTATALTILTSSSVSALSGATYRIVTRATAIDTPLAQSTSWPTGNAGSASTGATRLGMSVDSEFQNINVIDIDFNDVQVAPISYVAFRSCGFVGITAPGQSIFLLGLQTTASNRSLAASTVSLSLCYCVLRGTGSLLDAGLALRAFNCLIERTADTASIIVVSPSSNSGGVMPGFVMGESIVSGNGLAQFGLSISGTFANNTIRRSVVKGCVTGISIGNNFFQPNGNLACVLSLEVSNSSGVALLVTASSVFMGNTSAVFGTTNGTAISVIQGGRAKISSTSTITGTTEISVDGVTTTLAAMRALSPKAFPATPNVYGSVVYE